MLIAYDRDFKETSGYVTPKNFLKKMNKSFNDEFEFKLSDEIKKQILESRKIPMSQMIPQEEVEREFL